VKNSPNQLRYTALYCRLSRDDGMESESNSISVQKTLLTKYAADHGYTVTKFYVDDGYSGANFERPGFKEMLADAEAGKIGTIIVKDMSRFGRNYLEVGYYTEKRFPTLGIRFIAVYDGVDSNDQSSNEFTPFRNIINEWYCRDCSRKMKASYKARAANGSHLSGFASYGYAIDPDDKKHLTIDPVAAAVVKRIFMLFINGMNLNQIACTLNDEGIPAPREYKLNQGIALSKGKHALVAGPNGWRQQSVRRIIDNYVYCGHSISLKTSTTSYVTHEKIINDKAAWVVVHNTHEAIIDESTFETAQKRRHAAKNITKNQHEKGPLNLMLFCADCGGKMYYHRHSNATVESGGFSCGTHNLYKTCSPHSIPRDILEAGVLANLRKVISLVVDSESDFRDLMSMKRASTESAISSKARTELHDCETRANEIDAVINKLFEQNVSGVLSDKRFQQMLKSYESEQATLNDKIENLRNLIEGDDDDSDEEERIGSFIKMVKQYTEVPELTFEIASSFIKRVLVNECRGNGRWHRQYSVIVEYNFIGAITLPKEHEGPVDEVGAAVAYPAMRQYLINNEQITNANVRELTGMNMAQASKYLRRLCEIGAIEVGDKKTYGRYYNRVITVEQLRQLAIAE